MAYKVRSEIGKEILAHAAQEDYCVIEFSRSEDGELTVMDITDHHKQLEEMIDNE